MPVPVLRRVGFFKGLSLFLHVVAVHFLSDNASFFWLVVALSTCTYFYSVSIALRELRRLRKHRWSALAPLIHYVPLDAVWLLYLGGCLIVTVGWAASMAGITSFAATHTIMTLGEFCAKGMCTIASGLLQIGQRGVAVALEAQHREAKAMEGMAMQNSFAKCVGCCRASSFSFARDVARAQLCVRAPGQLNAAVGSGGGCPECADDKRCT